MYSQSYKVSRIEQSTRRKPDIHMQEGNPSKCLSATDQSSIVIVIVHPIVAQGRAFNHFHISTLACVHGKSYCIIEKRNLILRTVQYSHVNYVCTACFVVGCRQVRDTLPCNIICCIIHSAQKGFFSCTGTYILHEDLTECTARPTR